MKNIKLVLVMILLTFSTMVQADGFLKKATNMPILTQEGNSKHWCAICGMKIGMFYKTSHAAELKDNTKRQYCSIRCLSVDNKNNKIKTNSIQVVDAKTEKIIDAKTATYLVGSKIQGTMSKVSKIGFALKKDAQEFQKNYGGKILDFNKTFEMATASLDQDYVIFRTKREKKVYPKGKKLFEKMCNATIDFSKYKEINNLKADILNKRMCKKLKEKQLQAVTLYLWDVKRVKNDNVSTNKMNVGKDEKCPVCGMYTYKFPKWVSQLYFTHNDHEHHFTFDGVKDLMKFYLEPKKWGNYEYYNEEKISKILVTDYYTQKTIDARTAFFVINSDINGPMGYELIPFKNENDAKTFKKDHYGKLILKFSDINLAIINKLDAN